CLVVGPSADLRYLLGAKHRTSERLALLVVMREGPAHMVLPAFEAASLPGLPDEVRVETWGESDNPAGMIADLVRSGVDGNGRKGVADVEITANGVTLAKLAVG